MKTATKKYIMPALLVADFYKVLHADQYPKGTGMVYSTWTARTSRLDGFTEVVSFGLQAFIKKYLIRFFDESFFERPLEDVVYEYSRYIKHTLGIQNPNTSRLVALHNLGYLPLKIKAVPEGTRVPIRVPSMTIENTRPDIMPEFFWLTNFIETLSSCELWMPTTSATIADKYRQILDYYCELTGGDKDFVQFQGHDFSMRGMAGLHAARSSGAAHLLSFVGTDTIPAIMHLEEFYNADIENELVGTSIPATEHSVMCAYGQNEFESYKRLITEIYPTGFVSIVSDTWDLWKVLREVLVPLKDIIMNRDGRLIIRPDSGDPVKIMCGDPESTNPSAQLGVIQILWDIFGGTINAKGYKQLDPHIGSIYGDSITLERAEEICSLLMKNGFASTNVVYGIGSYTYQYNTRDTFGFALKSTFVMVGGQERNIFKDPVTDNGVKKSQTGMVAVLKDGGTIHHVDSLSRAERDKLEAVNLLEDVFIDGVLVRDESLQEIRSRLKASRDLLTKQA